eukprot:349867-Chlamydomonas_euryale.AAC.1
MSWRSSHTCTNSNTTLRANTPDTASRAGTDAAALGTAAPAWGTSGALRGGAEARSRMARVRRIDGWMYARGRVRRMDACTHARMDAGTRGRMHACTHARMDAWEWFKREYLEKRDYMDATWKCVGQNGLTWD